MCLEVLDKFPGNPELLFLLTDNIFTHFTTKKKKDTEIGPHPGVCCWGARGWGRCSTSPGWRCCSLQGWGQGQDLWDGSE